MRNLLVNSYLVLLFMLLVSSAAWLPSFLFRVEKTGTAVLGAQAEISRSAQVFRFSLKAAVGQNTYYANLTGFRNDSGRTQTFKAVVLAVNPKEASFSAGAYFDPAFSRDEIVLKNGESAKLNLVFRSRFGQTTVTPATLQAVVAVFPVDGI